VYHFGLLFYLTFRLGPPWNQGRRIKNFQGDNGKPRPRNTTSKPPSTVSISGRLGDALGIHPGPRSHLKRTLHQELRVKLKDFFWRISIFEKMSIFLEKFRPFSYEKLCVQILICP